MNNTKKTILLFIGHYLPGYKSGGPVRTIENMLDLIGSHYNFLIVTSDRDYLNNQPYENIRVNDWNDAKNSKIFYIARTSIFKQLRQYRKMINETMFDQYYLNSLFSLRSSILIILLWNLGLIPQKPILLAPRGELMKGALSIKSTKKRLFIFLVRHIKFYDKITWHASSEYEAGEIRREFESGYSGKLKINIALDPLNLNLSLPLERTHRKEKGILKILFISNITPKKNLKFAIEILNKVKFDFVFDIYGVVHDKNYWAECRSVIDDRISDKISYKGSIPNDQIDKIYSEYDLFFFPTLSENYGHVIFESLYYGCPVLCSGNTPWDKLDEFNAGWNIDLAHPEKYIEKIEELIPMESKEYKIFIDGCKKYVNFMKASDIKKDNINLFH